MQLFVEVMFYSGGRKNLPAVGYRPDAVFGDRKEYWGITFVELAAEKFDVFAPALVRFSFDGKHYKEVAEGMVFRIMEGAKQVGEGRMAGLCGMR